ncbi:RNA recognition motif domain [Macleaya cordata]|uniref:RNA recognition motif domain n=1 Tax=Macleaya cordata TaxID=56857 RepID=A0A200PPZ2_MACCD|nr:RNA recognition motif domain [Macleaya cordata]
MANTLDMSLDDLIKSRSNNSGRGRGRGRSRPGRARGGTLSRGRAAEVLRRGQLRPSSRTKDFTWQHDLFEDSLVAAGYSGIETGTKLYVSNLDIGVTNEDIKELFSEIGALKRYAVHYDRTGRSSGSAEVVFTRRIDALAAMKRYNNVQLDGKAMKIEIIGTNLGLPVPVSARVNVIGGANGRGRRTVVMTSDFGRGGASGSANRGTRRSRGGFQRGRGGRAQSRGRGRGRGRGKTQTTDKSAVDLDKELESYHAEAMQT